MKILVLADTHIPDRGSEIPPKIINAAKKVDMIIHVGDFTEVEVLEKLKSIAEVKAVCGNMDSVELSEVLPYKKVIKLGKFKIGLIHGDGPPDSIIQKVKSQFKEKLDCIIFGHAHKPFNEIIDGVIYFNPGSSTDKIFAPYNSYGILEINGEIKTQIKRI